MRNRKSAAIVAAVTALIGYCLAEARGAGDLLIFLSAAADLGHADIYSKTYFDGYHYYYSALFAWVLKPFWQMPYYWVKFVWLMLNAAMFLMLVKLVAQSAYVKALTRKQRYVFSAGTLLFTLRFFHENQHASQVTVLILFLTVYGLWFIYTGRETVGAAFLAAAINIKLLPVLFVPYLLYRKRFGAVLWTLVFLGAYYLLPYLILDARYYSDLMRSWWLLVNPANKIHVLDVDERSFHGLSTLLSTLLVEQVPDIHALDLKRNIASVSLSTLFSVLLLARAGFCAFLLYFLRWPPLRKHVPVSHIVFECAYLLLLVPLIFPHQQHYSFIFAVPAFMVCLYTVVTGFHSLTPRERIVAVATIIFTYLTANLKLIAGGFNEYYEHFKILTYGAIALVPLLAWARRKVVTRR
jgi:hypothetical protein